MVIVVGTWKEKLLAVTMATGPFGDVTFTVGGPNTV
jgi:hypothetical protein